MTSTTTRGQSILCRAIRWMALAVWALSPLCPLMADDIWTGSVQDDTWRYSYRYNNTKDEGYASILGLVDQDSPHEDLQVPATATLVIQWLDKTVTFGSGKLSLGLGPEFGKGLKCRNLYVPASVLWGGQVKDAEIEGTVYVTGSSPDFMAIGQGVFSGSTMKHVDFQCNVRTVWDRYDGGSFCDCPNLLSFSLKDGCRLELGQNSFLRCPKLSMKEIPEGVTTIGNAAFAACPSLVDVKLPSSVTNLGERAFEGCANLRHIDFGASLRSIGYHALHSCSNLLEIVIPDSVTSIGRWAFDECVGVTNICIGAGWTPLGDRFPGRAENLGTLTLCGNGETVLGNYAFAGLKMRQLVLKGVARIDDRARTDSGASLGVCHGCLNLEEVVFLDDALTSIGEYAFAECANLKEAVIPDSVVSVGYLAFSGCTSLTNIWIGSGWNPDVGGRFPNDAENLDMVTVCGNGGTTLGGGAFTGLKMRHLVLDGVKLIGDDRYGVYAGVFQSCPNLEEVVFWGDALTSIGTSAFAGCTALTQVRLPNSLTNVAGNAFKGCSALVSLDVAAGDQPLTIESGAFTGCGAFASVRASVPAEDGGDAYDVTAYVTGLPTPPFGKVTIQPELDPAKVSVKIGSTAAGEAALTPTSSADGMSLSVGVESAIPGLYYVLEQGTVPGGVSVPDAWKQATSSGGLKLVSSPSKDAVRFFKVKARLTAP